MTETIVAIIMLVLSALEGAGYDTKLMALIVWYEAPPFLAPQDQIPVAAAIRMRMLSQDQTLTEVLFAPHQFTPASLGLLDMDNQSPDGIESLYPLAIEALSWQLEDLPFRVDHFVNPERTPDGQLPAWAINNLDREVLIPGTVHRFFCLNRLCDN